MNATDYPSTIAFDALAAPLFETSTAWTATDAGDFAFSGPNAGQSSSFNSPANFIQNQQALDHQVTAPLMFTNPLVNSTASWPSSTSSYSSSSLYLNSTPNHLRQPNTIAGTNPIHTHTHPQPSLPLPTVSDIRCYDHGCDGRRFSSLGNYRRHIREKNQRAHTFPCLICGKLFTRSTARNLHQESGVCEKRINPAMEVDAGWRNFVQPMGELRGHTAGIGMPETGNGVGWGGRLRG
ncbi:hypothetical protein ABVK25_011809 [Lepraria finkii]|uniref:C2H2-type domain-containing protein n=1 Tax=Lepraria finkii TaxID=1340010 RepID=A0ABR4AL67_9LECA